MRRDRLDLVSADLCYIDPPFNSPGNYNLLYKRSGTDDIAQSRAFVDTWNWNVQSEELLSEIRRSSDYPAVLSKMIDAFEMLYGKSGTLSYLVNMTVRIHEIWRVLKPTGSFYLHCDPCMSHYLKIILDTVFEERGGEFKNEIAWQRHSAHNDGNRNGWVHDTILFYTKSPDYTFNRQYLPYDNAYIKSTYKYRDESTGRLYALAHLTAPCHGKSGQPLYFGERLLTPPRNRMWSWNQARIHQAMESGEIVFLTNGSPRKKRFLDEMNGIPMQDMWTDFYGIPGNSSERLGFNTQKPLALLERIIRSSSNEGDVVLDAFCGCGTAVDAAQMLNRRWIGIDITYQAVSLILKRLVDRYGKSVLDAVVVSGIPQDIESARALACKRDERLHKEFEHWSILTYANNMAKIEDHSDVIDGEAYIIDGRHKALFSVSTVPLTVKDVREFHTLVDRHASAGVIISLEEPSRSVCQEALRCGNISQQTCIIPKPIPKIQIVTVQQILDGVRMNLPLAEAVLQKAVSKKQRSQTPSFAGI